MERTGVALILVWMILEGLVVELDTKPSKINGIGAIAETGV